MSEDNLDLELAKKIMDEDHFGLKDVKDRIIEFMATGKLRKSMSKVLIIIKIINFHNNNNN